MNEIAYTNDQITVVHIEHLNSQGRLLGQWLGEQPHPRGRWGQIAQDAVRQALASSDAAGSPVPGAQD